MGGIEDHDVTVIQQYCYTLSHQVCPLGGIKKPLSLYFRPEIAVFAGYVKLDVRHSPAGTSRRLGASVTALVCSWKILLHTPVAPPTVRAAAVKSAVVKADHSRS